MLSALISGGLSALGGWLGMQGAKDANAQNAAIAAQNIALQREFAQSGIQWKVRDAQKAGVHPLYALGASTTSFAPVSVGAVNEAAPMANALGAMGQDVSRAAAAYRGPSERANAVAGVMTAQEVQGNALKLDNMRLQNEILRSRLALINQPGTPPGVEFPVPENKKIEERPPLMQFGHRWPTSPDTSPMKAWEDQYGDDGPASWLQSSIMYGRDAGRFVANRLAETQPVRFMEEARRAIQQYHLRRGRRFN